MRARTYLVAIACACGGEERVEVPLPVRDGGTAIATPVDAPPPRPLAAHPAEPLFTLPPCPGDGTAPKSDVAQHIVDLVGLDDAMTVVEIGSGSGYLLCRLSRAVGPRGRVIATEVAAPLVAQLRARVQRESLSNVVIAHTPATDVGLLDASVDRILLVNVWHHLPDRKHYAARVARALAPHGKLVIVDFEQPHPRAEHGIPPARVLLELAAGGLAGHVVPGELPGQYVVVAVRDPR